jgi:hypothetical protein
MIETGTSGAATSPPPSAREESRFPQILIISHIAEMKGGFAKTLMVETGADDGRRVRELSG